MKRCTLSFSIYIILKVYKSIIYALFLYAFLSTLFAMYLDFECTDSL